LPRSRRPRWAAPWSSTPHRAGWRGRTIGERRKKVWKRRAGKDRAGQHAAAARRRRPATVRSEEGSSSGGPTQGPPSALPPPPGWRRGVTPCPVTSAAACPLESRVLRADSAATTRDGNGALCTNPTRTKAASTAAAGTAGRHDDRSSAARAAQGQSNETQGPQERLGPESHTAEKAGDRAPRRRRGVRLRTRPEWRIMSAHPSVFRQRRPRCGTGTAAGDTLCATKILLSMILILPADGW